MCKNVLVIGNGFDLAHGLKTRYSEFLKWAYEMRTKDWKIHPKEVFRKSHPNFPNSSLLSFLLLEYEEKKAYSNWIDLEHELEAFVQQINNFIEEDNKKVVSETVGRIRYSISSSSKNGFTPLLRSSVSLFDAEDNRFVVKPRFRDVWGKIDKKQVYRIIGNELKELGDLFEYYLIEIEPTTRGICEKLDIVELIQPDYVISFNYTSTICSLYKISSNDVCYIHGRLNEDNLVLGYADLNKDMDDMIFKKYYRRLVNQTDIIDFTRLYETDNIGQIIRGTIHFFGHSLDISDEDILHPLLADYPSVIYYVDDVDRADKVQNIIRIIGKELAEKRIRDGEIDFRKIV